MTPSAEASTDGPLSFDDDLPSRPRAARRAVVILLASALAAGASLLILGRLGADGWTVLTPFANTMQIAIAVTMVVICSVAAIAFLLLSRAGTTRPSGRFAVEAATFMVIVLLLVASLVALMMGTVSGIRSYQFLRVPDSDRQWVMLEISGMGDTSFGLYSGSGMLYRQDPMPVPQGQDTISPFADGDYRVEKLGDGWRLSYPTREGGGFDARVLLTE